MGAKRQGMTVFSIGEVEQITSVKAHVLRYWEEIIPSLAPHKDMGGRRLYSKRDVQTVLRLKYLIQEKKYTIEGARKRLIEEQAAAGEAGSQTNGEQDFIPQLNQIRSELLDLYRTVHKAHREANE